MEREVLGKLVRATWITWAQEQPNPKASWLVPWDELDGSDKEVDRRIGEAVEEAVREEYEPVILDLVEMCQVAIKVLDGLDSRQSYPVTKQNMKLAIERGLSLFSSS